MRILTIVMLIATSGPLAAQSAMSGAEFDAYTKGKTLHFLNNGQQYGVERYFPGNRVEWSFLDGECQTGFWYQSEEMICFEYDENPTPQCWVFSIQNNKLMGVFEGDTSNTVLVEDQGRADPMLCLGPKIGV